MRGLRKFMVILVSFVFFEILALAACNSNNTDIMDDLEEIGDSFDDFFQDPNTEPIRATIKAGVPLGNIAAICMAVYQGQVIDGVSIVKSGSLATIHFGSYPLASEPLPFSNSEEGSVTVFGLWSSPDQAILTVVFTDYIPGVPSFTVRKVNTFPVQIVNTPEPHIMIVYSNIDIDIDTGSNPQDPGELDSNEQSAEFERFSDVENEEPIREDAEINVDIDAWVVRVFDNGTPFIFSDDEYNISGGGQYIDVNIDDGETETGVYQLGLAGVHISPDCSSNPLAGFAVIQEVGVGGDSPLLVAQAVLAFKNECNAGIQVIVATGNFVATNFSELDFDLNLP